MVCSASPLPVPPIACGLAALIAKNKFDDADRQMGISALFMGCIGITEGAIPFAVKDLGHTLPGICIGSAVGAALAAFQGIDCYVPHGGFIVALATNNVALFCAGHRDWLRGRRCQSDCQEPSAR